MKRFFYVEPTNEPHGEGMGFELCKPAQATSWAVIDHDIKTGEEECIDAFDNALAATQCAAQNQAVWMD